MVPLLRSSIFQRKFIVFLILGVALLYLASTFFIEYLTAQPRTDMENNTCTILSANDLAIWGRKRRYSNGVPRIIHYVFKSLDIPVQYSPHVRRCMQINTDAIFVFWTDRSVEKIIKAFFPHKSLMYRSYVDSKEEQLKLSDVNRYFILLKFGGIYMDLDTACQKPFDAAMENYSCILSTDVKEQSRIMWNFEFLAMNSLMACVPNHNFFQVLTDELKPADNTFIHHQTGPFFLTKVYKSYNKSSVNETDPTRAIVLADSYTFSPFTEAYLEKMCQKNLKGVWQLQGCKDLADHRMQYKLKVKKAIVVHLFLHLGYGYKKHEIKRKDSVCSSFNEAYIVSP